MFHRLLVIALAAAALAGTADAYRYNQFSMSPTPERGKRRSANGTNMRAIRAARKHKAQKQSKRQSKTSKNRR